MTDSHAQPDLGPEDGEDLVTAAWLEATAAVADGRLGPDEGIARLRALQAAHPADADWLEERIQTIRWAFAMDIEEAVGADATPYWDKILTVAEGLLHERVTPGQAVALLRRVSQRHPEHSADVQRLIDDITRSPAWQGMESGVQRRAR